MLRRGRPTLVLAGAAVVLVCLWLVAFRFGLPSSHGDDLTAPPAGAFGRPLSPEEHQERKNLHSVSRAPHRYHDDGPDPASSSSSSSACEPATVDTVIARFGRQSKFAENLQSLCESKCRTGTDPARRPPGAPASWRPSFCDASSSAKATRFDHGCYRHRDDDKDGDRDHDDECGVTAIFSTLGERFYGPGGQEYVWEAVRQWRLFHPAAKSANASSSACTKGKKNRIFMITNSSRLADPMMRRNASALHVTLVGHAELVTDAWRRYDAVFYVQGYMHPGGSRKTGNQHFNKLVTARFFAMQELMRRERLRHVMHMENDVMVYLNFEETVSAARSCGWRMASLFPHFAGVIPGLLYIRSSADLGEFTEFVNDLLSCGRRFGEAVQPGYANDMTYLKNFFHLRGGEWLGELPSSESAVAGGRGGGNCVADKQPNLLHDGASFGQWYSFAVKSSPPLRLPNEAGGGGGGDIIELPSCKAQRSSFRNSDEEDATEMDASDPRFFTTGCAKWEAPLRRFYQRVTDGTALSRALPPKNIQQAMKKGRFLDATPDSAAPASYVTWRRDSYGRLVPWWKDKLRLSSLHVHAKNLYLFRSR